MYDGGVKAALTGTSPQRTTPLWGSLSLITCNCEHFTSLRKHVHSSSACTIAFLLEMIEVRSGEVMSRVLRVRYTASRVEKASMARTSAT